MPAKITIVGAGVWFKV